MEICMAYIEHDVPIEGLSKIGQKEGNISTFDESVRHPYLIRAKE
jgi:hypothetical protein